MNIREGESVWTKKEIVKSSLLFVLHLVILIHRSHFVAGR